MKKIIKFLIVAPNAAPNGYGWDDVVISEHSSYEEAENAVKANLTYSELTILKVYREVKETEEVVL